MTSIRTVPWNGRLTPRAAADRFESAGEITLKVERDHESGWLAASWDAPGGAGGIARQGENLSSLQRQVSGAVSAEFEEGAAPARIRLHLVNDPIVSRA